MGFWSDAFNSRRYGSSNPADWEYERREAAKSPEQRKREADEARRKRDEYRPTYHP